MKNYYEILGVTQDASKAQIKDAYRGLVKKYHPDKNNDDVLLGKIIRDVNEANQVLSDRIKKLEYDQELSQYKLSQIFNPNYRTNDKTDFVKKQQQAIYKRNSASKLTSLFGLMLFLIVFMFYLFPIHDNEWEIAHKKDMASSNNGNGVDDLFGKEDMNASKAIINTIEQEASFEQSKVIDVTGPEVIPAPVVVTQSIAGGESKPVERTVSNAEVELTETKAPGVTSIEKTPSIPAANTTVKMALKEEVKPVETKLAKISNSEKSDATAPVKPVQKKITPPAQKPVENIYNASSKPAISKEKPLVKGDAKETVTGVRKLVRKIVIRNLSTSEMEKILAKVEFQKEKYNNRIRCIQIAKTSKSNIANAFSIADFLNAHGYAISGRKIVASNIKGVKVDARSGCITLTIGSM